MPIDKLSLLINNNQRMAHLGCNAVLAEAPRLMPSQGVVRASLRHPHPPKQAVGLE